MKKILIQFWQRPPVKLLCTSFACSALLVLGSIHPGVALADEAYVAVAANFLGPMQDIQKQFTAKTGHTLKISGGATGAFYTQIMNGAPFDVFLSADQQRPELLERGSRIVPNSRFTYAIGRLVLWSADPKLIGTDGVAVLSDENAFKYLALPNPVTAPYGAAAQQALGKLKLWEKLLPKIVRGQDLSQTFLFVSTGNAQLGFIAESQVLTDGQGGSHWRVPPELYKPIKQDAVLLKNGANNAAAIAFIEFLKSPEIREYIKSSGYDL